MRADRFGSYSMLTDRRRHAVLVALEVDDAVLPLVHRRRGTGCDDALVVPAAGLLGFGSAGDFSGFFFRSVMSAKSLTDPCRRPAVTGLYWRIPMIDPFLGPGGRDVTDPRRHSSSDLPEFGQMFSEELNRRRLSGCRVMMAFFQLDSLPILEAEPPLFAQAVLRPHLATRTPNNSSAAALISSWSPRG